MLLANMFTSMYFIVIYAMNIISGRVAGYHLHISVLSLNIFYCQILYSNVVGSHVLTTLVTTLPLHQCTLLSYIQ